MGILMHKGVDYSGAGGDNSRTMSYESYQNLSEAEKLSDTTFYIPDYPGLDCISKSDVVDNLESTATNLPLSANMGRELNSKLIKLWTTVLTFNCSAGYNEKSYNVYDSIVKIENLERIIPFVVSYDTAGMKPTIALPDHKNGNSTIWIETAQAGNVKVAFNMFYRVI